MLNIQRLNSSSKSSHSRSHVVRIVDVTEGCAHIVRIRGDGIAAPSSITLASDADTAPRAATSLVSPESPE